MLAPRGWAKVTLHFQAAPEGLRLTELTSEGTGAKQPQKKFPWPIDAEQEALRLGEAMGDVAAQLAPRWSGGRVVVERPSEEWVDWKLLRADGSVAWFTRLSRGEVGALLVTDALMNAIEGTEAAFAHLQSQLAPRLGEVRDFAFDAQAGVLRLRRSSGAVEVRAQLLGTYLTDSFTWVWGWSEEDAASAGTALVRRFCQPELQAEGLAALWRPHFYQDEACVWAVASHVAVGIGARGLFRAEPPGENGALLFAPMEWP